MNKWVVYSILYGLGVATGFAIYGLTDIKKQVRRKIEEYEFKEDSYDLKEKEDQNEEEKPLAEYATLVKEAAKRAREELQEVSKVDYASYHKVKEVVEAQNEVLNAPSEADIWNEFHEVNKDRPCQIITEEDFEKFPALYDRQSLYLYTYDYTLTDDQNEEITDFDAVFGEAFFDDVLVEIEQNDASVVYVANYAQDTIYDIRVIHSAFEPS